MLKQSLWQHF